MKEDEQKIIKNNNFNSYQNAIELQVKSSWLDKLKPCAKNSRIKEKIFNSNFISDNPNFSSRLKKRVKLIQEGKHLHI